MPLISRAIGTLTFPFNDVETLPVVVQLPLSMKPKHKSMLYSNENEQSTEVLSDMDEPHNFKLSSQEAKKNTRADLYDFMHLK